MDDENEAKRVEIAASLEALKTKVKAGEIRSMLVFAVDTEGADFHAIYMEKGTSFAELRGLAVTAEVVITEATKPR